LAGLKKTRLFNQLIKSGYFFLSFFSFFMQDELSSCFISFSNLLTFFLAKRKKEKKGKKEKIKQDFFLIFF